nr:uncharacterized protein LOC123759687 isoform X2 [Procambarus clarkii]
MMAHEEEQKFIHINPDFFTSKRQTKPKVHVNPAFLLKSKGTQSEAERLTNIDPQPTPDDPPQKFYPTRNILMKQKELSKPVPSKSHIKNTESSSVIGTYSSGGCSLALGYTSDIDISNVNSPLRKPNAHTCSVRTFPSNVHALNNTSIEFPSGNNTNQHVYYKSNTCNVSGTGLVKPLDSLATYSSKKVIPPSVYSWKAISAKVPTQNASLVKQPVSQVLKTPAPLHNFSPHKFHYQNLSNGNIQKRFPSQPVTSRMSSTDESKLKVASNINIYSPQQVRYNFCDVQRQDTALQAKTVPSIIKSVGNCKSSNILPCKNKHHSFGNESENSDGVVQLSETHSQSRNSNILINPKLLKYLSSNSTQDKKSSAISKPESTPLPSCIISNTGQTTTFPLKLINKNTIATADASKGVRKYKVISKTKLVRQTSVNCSSLTSVQTRNNITKVIAETPKRNGKYKIISKTKLVRRRSGNSFSDETKKVATKATPCDNGSLFECSPRFPAISVPFRFTARPRRYSVGTKASPKRRYSFVTHSKLNRRLSTSSSTNGDGMSGKPKYSIKTKTKLVRRYSGNGSSDLKSNTNQDGEANTSKVLDVERKTKFSVLSKTKLVRRKSDFGLYKTKAAKSTAKATSCDPYMGTLIRRHKLVRNIPMSSGKAAEDSHKRCIKTVYKIINRSSKLSPKQKAARGIISKYKINRLKSDSAEPVKKNNFRKFNSVLKSEFSHAARKGAVKHSDRIINIGGILYKSTKTSLTKQLSKIYQKNSGCIVWLGGDQFHLSFGGKTLRRITKGSETLPSDHSLSRVHIGGLTYSRTKAGQYELTKIHQARAVLSSAKQRSMITLSQRHKKGVLQIRNEHCIFFNRFGRCSKKDRGGCPYIHDPKRVAVCTRFLRGRCPVNNCPFSHIVDPDKMPVCSHFVRATCTRDGCPYRHVRVNPSAPICLDFLKGHCLSGEACKKQHILVCEEFSRTGKCPRGVSCPLSHRKGRGKKRKSVSLEPPIGEKMQPSVSRHKKRKISESRDVLGGPKVKRNGNKSRGKTTKAVKQRYFQVMSLVEDKETQEESEFSRDYTEEARERDGEERALDIKSDKVFVTHNHLARTLDKCSQEVLTNNKVRGMASTLGCHLSPNTSDFQETRQRLLHRVDKMKSFHSAHKHIVEGENDTKLQFVTQAKKEKDLSFSKTDLPNYVDQDEEIDKLTVDIKVQSNEKNIEHVKSDNKLFNNETRILTKSQLPHTLPSYIPLSMNDDHQDL